MLFRLVDVSADSRAVTFIFDNDGTFQLRVRTTNGNMFVPFASYDIRVSRTPSLGYMAPTPRCHSNVGVVTRKTRNSVHIASGVTYWMLPLVTCSFNPGMDVWISASLVDMSA